jgi:hypothetical protein
MPPNRIVALLTPAIAVAAGAVSTWLADNVSGLDLEAGQLEAIFVAALAAVLAPAAQFLHGWQKYERHEEELEREALEADREAAQLAAVPDAYYIDDDEDEYDDYDPADEEDAVLYAAARDEAAEPALSEN